MIPQPVVDEVRRAEELRRRLVDVPLPSELAATLARFSEEGRTGSVVAEFHMKDGALQSVKVGTNVLLRVA